MRLVSYVILLMVIVLSCENQDIEFPDYAYSTTYFAFQYPVRTLVLGDYYFDNENDNNFKFSISATMAGVYENKEDRLVDFIVDESLVEDMYIGSQKLLPLPTKYYTLSNDSRMIIPKGKMYGGIDVQLTEDFFNDPNTIGPSGTVYVVPVRITASTTDSVFFGSASVENPDYRNSAHWGLAPKNYTLWGVNYINEYHGNFLLRGVSTQYDKANIPVDAAIYRTRDVETDRVVAVSTASRNSVKYSKEVSRKSGSSPGNFIMLITLDAEGNGIITTDPSSPFPVSGTATFAKDSESWGGKLRHAFYLDYEVDDGTYLNKAKDTLVFRDKGVYFQQFTPTYNP